MLGLSSGLLYSQKGRLIEVSYTSDFSSDADSWVADSVQNSASDLAMVAGQTAPGSSDNDWLMCTYAVSQTSQSGILLDSGVTPSAEALVDFGVQIYLGEESGSEGTRDWTGAVDVFIYMGFGGYNLGIPGLALNAIHTIERVGIPTSTNSNFRIIFQTSDDYPLAGARFYIRNLNFEVYS